MGAGTSRIELEIPNAGALLPRELLWLYPLAPVLTAPLLINGLFDKPLWVACRCVLATYVPFIALPLAIHSLYGTLMPRLLPRAPRAWQRGLLHVLLTSLVAGAVAFAVLPLHNLAADKVLGATRFVAISVVLSWALVFPALAIQRFRLEAQRTERLAQLERQAHLEAQLQALQARTNPHFFFNSINTVSSLIPDNPALAERTLERLADLFRYALDASKTRTVPLSREVEMVRDYLEIQGARFGSRLRSSVELDPAAATLEVPPLLLQPLVENAILHGLADRKQGLVAVEIRKLAGQVIIEVRDDGPGPGASQHRGTQTGVKDLRDRLRILYGEGSSFSLDVAPGGGCLARMAIPLGAR